MRIVISIVAAFLLVILAFSAMPASAQGTQRSAGWSADAASLKSLRTPTTFEKYTLRVPKGYHMRELEGLPQGTKIWVWNGAVRDDGTKAFLTLKFMTLPPQERDQVSKLSLEQLTSKLAGAQRTSFTNWKEDKIETGLINGIRFARVRWKGTNPTNKRDLRGLVYATFDGNTIVELDSQDWLPAADKTLPTIEASILTFRKK